MLTTIYDIDDHIYKEKVQFQHHIETAYLSNGIAKVEDGNLYYLITKSTSRFGVQVTTFSSSDIPLCHHDALTIYHASQYLTDIVDPCRFLKPEWPDTILLDLLAQRRDYSIDNYCTDYI